MNRLFWRDDVDVGGAGRRAGLSGGGVRRPGAAVSDGENPSMLIIEFAITSACWRWGCCSCCYPDTSISAGSGVGLIGGIAAVLVMRFAAGTAGPAL